MITYHKSFRITGVSSVAVNNFCLWKDSLFPQIVILLKKVQD